MKNQNKLFYLILLPIILLNCSLRYNIDENNISVLSGINGHYLLLYEGMNYKYTPDEELEPGHIFENFVILDGMRCVIFLYNNIVYFDFGLMKEYRIVKMNDVYRAVNINKEGDLIVLLYNKKEVYKYSFDENTFELLSTITDLTINNEKVFDIGRVVSPKIAYSEKRNIIFFCGYDSDFIEKQKTIICSFNINNKDLKIIAYGFSPEYNEETSELYYIYQNTESIKHEGNSIRKINLETLKDEEIVVLRDHIRDIEIIDNDTLFITYAGRENIKGTRWDDWIIYNNGKKMKIKTEGYIISSPGFGEVFSVKKNTNISK